MANDLWTMHHGSEVRHSASEEFIGYVAMTGDPVIESTNIELSNYFSPTYESQFNTIQPRKNILVLPILDPHENINGVLEIISYT